MKAAIFKGVKQMACEEHAEPTIPFDAIVESHMRGQARRPPA